MGLLGDGEGFAELVVLLIEGVQFFDGGFGKSGTQAFPHGVVDEPLGP